jgi:hypothetical protein
MRKSKTVNQRLSREMRCLVCGKSRKLHIREYLKSPCAIAFFAAGAHGACQRQRRLAVRSFKEPVDLGGHDEIVFMQAFDLFRLDHHRDVAPAKADIRVMTFGLGELTHLLNERESLAKVANSEGPFDAERNRRDFALEFFEHLLAKTAAAGGPPPLGLQILMGESTAIKVHNTIANIAADSIAPVELIARKV